MVRLVVAAMLATFVVAWPVVAEAQVGTGREVVFVLDGSSSVTPGEWRALTRGVEAALSDPRIAASQDTVVSAVAFGTGPGAGARPPVVEVVLEATALTDAQARLQAGLKVRGADQIEGGTAVLAGLRAATSQIGAAGAAASTTVCLVTDGIENVEAASVGDSGFLRAAGADRFSVVSIEDPDASERELRAEYGPLVFGERAAVTVLRNRGALAASVIDGCLNPQVTVTGIEVTQGVQDLDNSVRLIRDRTAYVRVLGYANDPDVKRWRGTLEVTTSTGRLLRSVAPEDFGALSNAGASSEDLRRTAMTFRVPHDVLDSSSVTFTFRPASGTAVCQDVDADCSVTAEPVSFERDVVIMGFNAIRMDDRDVLNVVFDSASTLARAQAIELALTAEQSLPFRRPSNEIDYRPSVSTVDATDYLDAVDAFRASPTDTNRDLRNAAAGRLRRSLLADVERAVDEAELPPSTLVYGYVDIPGLGGRAAVGAPVSAGEGMAPYWVHAHEIGHLLGLEHAAHLPARNGGGAWADRCGAVTEPNGPRREITRTMAVGEPWNDRREVQALGPDRSGNGYWGYLADVAVGGQVVGLEEGLRARLIDPSTTPNLMGYCQGVGSAPTAWLGGDQWNDVLSGAVELDAESSLSVRLLPGEADAIAVDAYRTRSFAWSGDDEDATHRMTVRDADGDVVTSLQVAMVDVVGYSPGARLGVDDPDALVPTSRVLPLRLREGSAYRLEVTSLLDGDVVADASISSASPRVDLDAAPGEASDTVDLSWAGTDEDGDALSYDVQLRADDRSWITLVADTADTSAQVDLRPYVASGTVRLRVVASDGMRVADDEVSVRYSSTASPTTTGVIAAPVDASSYTWGESVPLEVLATSTGRVRRVRWVSDLDGTLDVRDEEVDASELSPGVHRLTAFVDVEANGTETAVDVGSVTISVRDAPLALASTAAIDRIAGEDRYATAAAIAARQWSDGADVVFLASGEVFADALSAGPAAARVGAPMLLTSSLRLPSATLEALRALEPADVVVVGGEVRVPPGVVDQVRDAVPGVDVTRVAGPNRYATAAEVAALYFRDANRVYLSTGTNFPDALTGGAVAGTFDDPVVLVEPGRLPDETAAFLARTTPENVVVLGGEAAVSSATERAAAAAAGGAVTSRVAGPDRYATAGAVGAVIGRASTVWIVTGRDFPDGLAIAPAAAIAGLPVLLVEPDALPAATAEAVRSLGAVNAVVVGGPAAVSFELEQQLRSLLQDNLDP